MLFFESERAHSCERHVAVAVVYVLLALFECVLVVAADDDADESGEGEAIGMRHTATITTIAATFGTIAAIIVIVCAFYCVSQSQRRADILKELKQSRKAQINKAKEKRSKLGPATQTATIPRRTFVNLVQAAGAATPEVEIMFSKPGQAAGRLMSDPARSVPVVVERMPNPLYAAGGTSAGAAGSSSGNTVVRLPNPLYTQTDSDMPSLIPQPGSTA